MAVLAVNIGDTMKGMMIMGYEYQEKFVDKANEILANQMKTKPEWIDRKALIKALEADFNTDWADYASKNNFDKDYIDGVRDEYDDVMKIICKQPVADVQPVKRGRWENEYLDDDVWWADCTNCKNDTHSKFGRVSTYAYCPNCGADMREHKPIKG